MRVEVHFFALQPPLWVRFDLDARLVAVIEALRQPSPHYLSTSEVRLATQTSPLMSIVPIFLGDITYNPLWGETPMHGPPADWTWPHGAPRPTTFPTRSASPTSSSAHSSPILNRRTLTTTCHHSPPDLLVPASFIVRTSPAGEDHPPSAGKMVVWSTPRLYPRP